MPNITEVFNTYNAWLTDTMVIRLHGYDRNGIEKECHNIWNKIIQPKDDELPVIMKMINTLNSKGSNLYININNHYEGSARLTIDKIKKSLPSA